MYGDSNPTGAFGSVQWVLIAVIALAIALAIGVTAGLSILGLSGVSIGAVFLVIFGGLLILAWPVFRAVHPGYAQDRE